MPIQIDHTTSYTQAPVRVLEDPQGRRYGYRAINFQDNDNPPLVLLTHLAATLDNWDPLLVDLLAKDRTVIAIDYPGVASSTGSAPTTVEGMARAVLHFLDLAGLKKVDLLGLSLGGFVAQDILRIAPERVRAVILAGTGPAGGDGITKVPAVTFSAMAQAFLSRRDPRHFLFFPKAAWGKAGDFLERLATITHRDHPIRVRAFLNQLKAVVAWGKQQPQDLGTITHPALVINGDNDIMVPTPNTVDLGRRLPNATLVDLYPEAGHGAIFQEPRLSAQQIREFLANQDAKELRP